MNKKKKVIKKVDKKVAVKKTGDTLEFLVTYGWAFLLLLAMIALLAYFGFLTPNIYNPDNDVCDRTCGEVIFDIWMSHSSSDAIPFIDEYVAYHCKGELVEKCIVWHENLYD